MIPSYEIIEELLGSDQHVLYRARRRTDQRRAILKLPLRSPPLLAEIESLEHEFRILQRLSTTGVLRAEEILRHDGNCCLVFEDRGWWPIQPSARGRALDLDSFLNVA